MRQIQAPGIELNEFDRSQYNILQPAVEDAPYCLICGFSDKGENYAVKYLNNKTSLLQTFGSPQTEFEKYFYNGCLEIISNGGICLATRLPYDNESLNKFTYCDYIVDQLPKQTGNILDITEYNKTFVGIQNLLIDLIQTTLPFSKYKNKLLADYNLLTLKNIVNCIEELREIYLAEKTSSTEQFEELKKVKDIFQAINQLIELSSDKNKEDFCHLRILDSNLTSYISIIADESNVGSGKITMSQFDDLKVGNVAAIKNKIRIVDISRSNYDEATQATVSSYIKDECTATVVETNDCLGIVPVIVSPVNALYFQEQLKLIGSYAGNDNFGNDVDGGLYSQINSLSSVYSPFMAGENATLSVDMSSLQNAENLVMPLSSSTTMQQSVSRMTALQFPNIIFNDAEHLDTKYLKHIGVVVLKAYRDNANSGQVGFQLLESFVGSLDRNAKDKLTGASIFIDKIVNQSSHYINIFSNVPPQTIQQASIIAAVRNRAYSLGFYQLDLVKNISLHTSIIDALSKLFMKTCNRNEFPIDIIIDAGVSNIAQNVYSKSLAYNKDMFVQQLNSAEDARIWQSIIQKFDDFCKYTRKDCMFIADGLRTFCLINDSKIVRDTDPASSVQNSIIPKLKYMAGINSSYSAGYCNWFLVNDEYTGDQFWCPPSIKVLRSYIYCDTYCHPWSVPAGMNRGRIYGAVDVAFQPTIDEAGKIYSQTWNYAVSYPADGIIIEGQKTFQKAYTALDRVNVRRLMLYLEKSVVRLARYFLYEGNTEYLRQQFVDAITPIFDDAISNNGIVDYAIKCDAELNTAQVIENNEMRCKIAVKPVKALEFLVLDFIVTNQSADVNEEVRR